MARIYIPHSNEFDFKTLLYTTIRESELGTQHEIIFPHEKSDLPFNSRDVLKTVDFVIAEASYPSTGMGIELGWADEKKIPIGIIYQNGKKVSSGLRIIASAEAEYHDEHDIALALQKVITALESSSKK